MKKDKITDESSVLKQYYGRYLTEVLGRKNSTVVHYYDALNHISRRLKANGFVEHDIYEIRDINKLYEVRDWLNTIEDYRQLNARGNQMYSAGLNRYIEFAEGKFKFDNISDIAKLDIPVKPENPIIIEQQVYKRSDILRLQIFAFANYTCEMDNTHQTFIAESTGKPYMESHHAIPIKLQGQFDTGLDIYANLVCLCPLCHRRIHYGLKKDRLRMINKIYTERADRLNNSGIRLNREEFADVIINS